MQTVYYIKGVGGRYLSRPVILLQHTALSMHNLYVQSQTEDKTVDFKI